MREVVIPDIGDFENVEVIEVVVKPGDEVAPEDPLITLESDKATMEVPAPFGGVVAELKVNVGDKVSGGTLIALMQTETAAGVKPAASAPAPAAAARPQQAEAPSKPAAPPDATPAIDALEAEAPLEPPGIAAPVPPEPIVPAVGIPTKAHASPSVRRYARELGVDLEQVKGTGPKGRILRNDVNSYVKAMMSGASASVPNAAGAVSEPPPIDFSRFGPVETKPLSKIKRVGGQRLHRSWITAPHVTQFNEADVTELEEFRKAQKEEADKQGIKLTMLSFLLKAAVAALKQFPEVNSSLAPGGGALVYKQYFHIGVAVNTDNGLVVPVIRDVDKKGLFQLAQDVQEMTDKARRRKLTPDDFEGGCFTISSLGGLGGTQFTPIINVPEVAILGVSRAAIKPVFQNGAFVPRLMLPLALSYDHRVIDGVAGAQFIDHLRALLSDIRRLLL
jgi:pyruvate dehydrogenase E2 component (dihydrolipoamide acetyltransferase)